MHILRNIPNIPYICPQLAVLYVSFILAQEQTKIIYSKSADQDLKYMKYSL